MLTETTMDSTSLKESLPPDYHRDFTILCGGRNPQYIVFTGISYLDHNNDKKIIASAVYNVIHKTKFPLTLPTLLPPLQTSPAYELHDIPGKGKGLIAVRDIAFGEIVIVERPILIYPRMVPLDVDFDTKLQICAKRMMDSRDWNRLNDLSNVMDDVSEFDGIRNTNAFSIELQKGRESYSGIFPELSRVNHSCGPNLRHIWNPHLLTYSAQAVRPIRAGQELTISYSVKCLDIVQHSRTAGESRVVTWV